MKIPKWRSFWRGASLQRDVEELRDVLTRYVKEETIGPLKGVGRYLAVGALGSLFVGFGSFLMLLGILRYLQWQFRFLDGSESWIPYVVVCLLGVLGFALTTWRIFASVGSRRRGTSD